MVKEEGNNRFQVSMSPWPLQFTHFGKGDGQWKAKWGSLKHAIESRFTMADCKDFT